MDISKVVLNGPYQKALDDVAELIAETQSKLDDIHDEYQAAINALNEVKSRIIPLKQKLSPLAELQASIASRRSRTKYFPEYATRNFNDSKDQEFLSFANEKIKEAKNAL